MSYNATQPGAIAGMDVKNVKNLPRNADGERQWSNGLFGCCGQPGTCCFAWFCPSMAYSQVKSRLASLNDHGRPHPSGGDMCGSDCFLHCALTACLGAGWILQIGQRNDTRQRYRIAGGSCHDCLSAGFCSPCEITQESQELALEEQALMGQIQAEQIQDEKA